MSGLGTNKIVAVDADFDLLIDDYSEYTEMVRNHPYVINTTWYSLENILMQKVSSISLLKNFSRVFKGYFVRYLRGVSNKSIKPKGGFGGMLQKLNIQKLALEGDFSGIVNSEEIDVQDSASFQEKFDKMGIADADLWKLMRGHNLWNMIVKPVEEKLLNCKIHEIIQENLKEGNPIARHKAMQTLGINCSVKEYLDKSFYYNQLELVSAPRETQNKLNRLFS